MLYSEKEGSLKIVAARGRGASGKESSPKPESGRGKRSPVAFLKAANPSSSTAVLKIIRQRPLL